MKYGFVIDNRKCIGCHACTTACKSEHQVPVGVNRTWVKQVEKGTFPDTRRLFSVMRCNHCTDAPCVEICPTEALHYRPDGIVDFDNDRCIGCKSCMQACPYDALYINPENSTAAKCNYCAHRVDAGIEPACVVVCPEHAIISGDMDNPESEIAQLLSRQAVKVRKPEKGTNPNLFYIDGDDASLIPTATDRSRVTMWSSQALGVGHYAKEAEKMAFSSEDVVAEAIKLNGSYESQKGKVTAPKSIEVLMDSKKQVYNTPDKGILWGWEVSGYVWTKAIAAGSILVPAIASLFTENTISPNTWMLSAGIGLIFLMLTGLLLVKDLDRPDRFLYVLLRPHWGSWLVKGGYAITVYGGLLSLLLAAEYFNWDALVTPLIVVSFVFAIVVAVYTAFLFAQAKGRDFWQSPTLALHMVIHSLMAGAAVYMLLTSLSVIDGTFDNYLRTFGIISIVANLVTIAVELLTTHPTTDAKMVVSMITKGRYKNEFWFVTILIGNLIPLALLMFNYSDMTAMISAIALLIGIYSSNKIWVEAPQRISLV
ncbi:MAG TPA: polysulfide reductase NrfD [Saprospiraceae bacterium]|nr:polysulfide reductase NrfD [Saprospiraceae bacterium]HRX28770.1 polysulfide reductase NrfD [Saprospiraceae bacterium]